MISFTTFFQIFGTKITTDSCLATERCIEAELLEVQLTLVLKGAIATGQVSQNSRSATTARAATKTIILAQEQKPRITKELIVFLHSRAA